MWRLLGGLLLGALVAGAAVYVVKGIIDKKKARIEMQKANLRAAVVKMASSDTVKLEDLTAIRRSRLRAMEFPQRL